MSALVFCGTSGFLSQNVQLKKIIKSTISSSKNPQEEKNLLQNKVVLWYTLINVNLAFHAGVSQIPLDFT